jgi:hypothetical protein
MEIIRVVKRKNNGISISYVGDDGEQYGLLLRPEQIVANYEAAQQSAQADVLVRCEKCNALIETTVHCDVCGTFEPTRRSRKPLDP